jgi:hypothetical protein
MARAVALCLWAAAAIAAPPLTRIQDTLYRADGSRFEGVLQVDWKSFRAADGSEVSQNSISVTVIAGQLSVDLIPTTNAVRPVSYTVRYNSAGRTQFTETWAVPPAVAVLRVNDVRVNGPAAGGITTQPITVEVQNVVGLRTELDLRPARGATWVAGRSAVIGSTGAIEAAVGNNGDCVHVDGSSGPCGDGGLRFVDAEIPLGTIDGVNTQFQLSAAPFPASSLNLYVNGVLQRNYTLTGSTVVLAPGSAPQSGDSLSAWYRIDSGTTPTIEYADLETPAGAINSVNREFMLSATPFPAASLRLYRNGVLQKAGLDYALSVNCITFYAVATPQTGDVLQATFRK